MQGWWCACVDNEETGCVCSWNCMHVHHRAVADAQAARLRAALPQRNHQARLHSASTAPGSAWLQAIPYSHNLRVPDFAFQVAAKLRLGVTGVLPGAPASPCSSCCMPIAGNDLIHSVSSRKNAKQWNMRHNLINAAVRRVASRAGCPSTAEQHYAALGSTAGSGARGDASLVVTPGPDRLRSTSPPLAPCARPIARLRSPLGEPRAPGKA